MIEPVDPFEGCELDSLERSLVPAPMDYLGRELVRRFAYDGSILFGSWTLQQSGGDSFPLEPHRLMGNVDAALMQQILDIPQRKRITDVHHHREADNLGVGLEVAEVTGVRHDPEGTAALPLSRQPNFPLTVPLNS